MKALLLAAILFQLTPRTEAPRADPRTLAYTRTLALPTAERANPQACAVLDAQIFPHAAPSLRDLRLFATDPASSTPSQEIPYAITLSQTVTEDTQPAHVLNLGEDPGGLIEFDLEMPNRPYTDVELDLTGHDFLATAIVSGRYDLDSLQARPVALGAFTLFDLAAQHLSRNTTLQLQESTFRYLHIEIKLSPAPGTSATRSFTPSIVTGAHVPPSREAQVVYTTVERATTVTLGPHTSPRHTRFDIALPLRVPVERISFDLPPSYKGNFIRDVEVHASPQASQPASPSDSLPTETVRGTISRVHLSQAGHAIDEEKLSLPATLGANLQTPAHVWVEIDNGDDQPLPIAAVRLEMRQRKLCFNLPGTEVSTLTLDYGDPTLLAPVYDYARLFTPSPTALTAQLGPERPNPLYHPSPPELRPFTERHPEVLWITLIVVVCALGAVALKSSKSVGT